jgi:hypothetical protein
MLAGCHTDNVVYVATIENMGIHKSVRKMVGKPI